MDTDMEVCKGGGIKSKRDSFLQRGGRGSGMGIDVSIGYLLDTGIYYFFGV